MQNGNRLGAFFRGTQDIIPENEVTAERLVEVFQQAFLTATITEFGNVEVTLEDGLMVLVRPLEFVSVLKIYTVFGLRNDTEEIDKLRLLNSLNAGLIATTHSMPEPDSLVVGYFLPYSGGLLPQQLVKALRLFVKCAVSGIHKHDSAGLVSYCGW
jgi:hypothetical protein